jgi:hypothetical protein
MKKTQLTVSEIKKKFNKYKRVIQILDETPEIIPVVNIYYRLHYKHTKRKLGGVIVKIMRIMRYSYRRRELFKVLNKYTPKRRRRKAVK